VVKSKKPHTKREFTIEEQDRILRQIAEHERAFRRETRKISILIFFLALLLLAPCAYSIHYASLPRSCETQIATVTRVVSNEHCTMGCRGYDHLVQFSGIRGVTEQYVHDDDSVWRVAGPGDRISMNVCVVKGHKLAPPEIKILGRAP